MANDVLDRSLIERGSALLICEICGFSLGALAEDSGVRINKKAPLAQGSL
jgi:hypothetical protein